MIECKPKNLWNTKENTLKREAAIIFCRERNMKYKVIDMKVDEQKIIDFYERGLITLTKESEKKLFEKAYCSLKKRDSND